MVLFSITLVVVAAAVGVYAHYNPGTMDITLRTYHFTGIPSWEVLAGAAGVALVPFLLHAVYASVRIRLLRRAGRRGAGDQPATGLSAPTPKRSWLRSADRAR